MKPPGADQIEINTIEPFELRIVLRDSVWLFVMRVTRIHASIGDTTAERLCLQVGEGNDFGYV